MDTSRTFIWSMFGNEPIGKFDRFSKLSLVKGKKVTELLEELVELYIKSNDVQGTLVDERTLLERLLERGITVSRITLKNYRRADKLVGQDSQKLWFTDGRNICYHLEGCLEFFEERRRKKQRAQAA